MAQITKIVDKTLVAGSEIFVYSVNVSYSELSQPSENGYLLDFFPSKIKFTLPQIGGQIKNITQIPTAGGTTVRFDFGAVNAGTSLSFTIACSFGPGRVDNDSFINTATLFTDQIQVATGIAPIVNLTLVPLFNLTKNTLNPIVRPNDVVTMTLILANNGDAGSTITNVVINDTLPIGLTSDTSFVPVGNDIPSNGYSDPTYNGRLGSWTQNILHFELPSFSGVYYAIKFRVIVDTDVIAGQKIVNTALWTVNGIPRLNALLHLSVFTPANAFTLTKTGVRSGIAGSPVNFISPIPMSI